MSNSNGMYNVLNIFKKLQPLQESTAKEVAKEIYESVEAKGSILEGVSKVEQRLREQFDAMEEERETLKTKKGIIYKGGTYGTEYDGDDAPKKPKHVPKKGQKGRPKKEKPAEFSAPKGDIFGRTTGVAPKGKKGTVIKGKANIDTVDEAAKPDYLDMDKDGNKKEPMKKAIKDKKKVSEGINFGDMMKETEMSVSEMFAEMQQDMQDYKRTGHCSDKLEAFLKIHNHGKKQLQDSAPVPYEVPAVQRKAAGAAPLTPAGVQQQDANRSMHPGMTKLGAPAPANGPVATPASKAVAPVAPVAATEELEEIARLAGIAEAKSPKAKKDYDKDGEVESEKDEVIGSRRKAAGLDENCDMSIMGGAQAMQDQAGKISVNTSASSDGNKTVNISADGDAADQLMQMLKMAGMGGDQAEKHVQLMIAKPEEGGSEEGPDEEVDEATAEYTNTPHEEYGSVEQIKNQGTDMNRQKQQFADKPRQGDNPMATENIDVVSNMGRDLMAEYQALKLSK